MAAIKLFRAVRKYFEAMGFYPPLPPDPVCSLNRKNGFYFLAVTGQFVPIAAFIFLEAQTVYEYSNSFYMLITTIAMTNHFMVFFHRMGTIVKLIENYQKFIETREWLI